MSSPHFRDWQPELDPGQEDEDYEQDMSGDGRWGVLLTEDDEVEGAVLIGTLWTDDVNGLGLVMHEGSDRDHFMSVLTYLRKAKADDRPVTDVFEELIAGYEPDVYGEGDLTDLLDAITS